MFELLLNATEVFPSSIFVLFWILLRSLTSVFCDLNCLFKQVIQRNVVGSQNMLKELKAWNCRYVLVCQSVKRINSCFDPIVLIAVRRSLFGLINNLFLAGYQLSHSRIGYGLSSLAIVLYQAAILTFLIHASHRLHSEVYIS